MKKFLISFVMLLNVSVAGLFAQNLLVATLSHGDSISMYYGNNAFNDALNAAVSGDVISLSGGNFTCPNVTKAITIRGTGIDVSVPTIVTNNFDINIIENEPGKLSLEGINFIGNVIIRNSNGSSAYFTKCKFNNLAFNNSSIYSNITNCKILAFKNETSNRIQCSNSYIGCSSINEGVNFMNCIIEIPSSCVIRTVQAANTIFFTVHNRPAINGSYVYCSEFQLPPSSTTINCVAINMSKLFNTQSETLENKTSSFEYFFKNYTDGKFELTDEAKTEFLGTDSTEVGWCGGVFPYTSIPSYPRITKMNVANKSTADGKLSVEIEVSAAK